MKKSPEEYYRTGLCSHNAQHISGTGIAAPMLADIDMINPSIQIAGLNQAECITDCNTNKPFHTYCSFPFLSRTKNLREVPRKPNASRILFSRYLVYEKCISTLSFTKITRSGGFTETCVI